MIHKELMSKRELKAYEKLEKQVMFLNHNYKVGEVVSVRKDDGSLESDKITNPFQIMCGGIVGWLEINRCYLAERISKL